MKISTFIINLKTNSNRREHIEKEFEGRNEFQITIVEASTNTSGNAGLWQMIKHIVKDLANREDEFILICEDDHLFTKDYFPSNLFYTILEAQENRADVLFGGLSWFEDAVQVSDNLFSVKKFSGTQFTIIFKKFFSQIINAPFRTDDIVNGKISHLSDSIYFISPFISVQKEFEYSDATQINNGIQKIKSPFISSAAKAKKVKNIRSLYLNSYNIETIEKSVSDNLDEWTIPTYILNLPERKDRKAHILGQFDGKPEFDIQIIEAVKHQIGAFGHWQSVRKVAQLAIENEDDVIVFCEDDHEFTPEYSKKEFFKSILTAHQLRCEYLSGGAGRFDLAVPISESLFWTDHCLSTQFIIIFKNFFQKILDTPFDEKIVGDIKLSMLAVNKMLIAPFISIQKDIGLSDITQLHNDQKGIVQKMFSNSSFRINNMKLTYEMHKNDKVNTISSGSYNMISNI